MNELNFYDLSDYTVPARGRIDRIYLHWTGGDYDTPYSAYHINIDGDGGLWTDMTSFTEHKSHTWRRNSRAIGIALCCAKGSWIDEYGNVTHKGYAPTPQQLYTMAKVVAKLCIEIGLDIDSCVYTHAEVADIDGYGLYGSDPDIRWDLFELGNYIRAEASEYAYEWSL